MKEDKKAIYILSDFVKNFIEKIGPIPDDYEMAEEWFKKMFLVKGSAWLDKYESNSMKDFAKKVALAYMDMVDDTWKNKFAAESMTFDDYIKDKDYVEN